MKYKCYLCGGTIEVDEQADIDYYNKCKYPTCFNCYIKITDVIMDGQFNELIHRKCDNGHVIRTSEFIPT